MTVSAPMSELARAKVNLTLRVLGRRRDGFHELDSVVALAGIGDRVTMIPGGYPSVEVTGPFASAIAGENLVMRTLQLVAEEIPSVRLGSVAIDKQLPVAAGLGGGSADAAAVLRLVLQSYQRGRRKTLQLQQQLEDIAVALGSDVLVCFHNVSSHMTGRGETVKQIHLFPSLPAVLINPQVLVPEDKTRQVFARLEAPPLDQALLQQKPVTLDAAQSWQHLGHGCLGEAGEAQLWRQHILDSRNDLEAPATAIIPAIAGVLAAARADKRTVVARLSGAGPTCFALTATLEDAFALAADLAAQHPSWWVRATQLGT